MIPAPATILACLHPSALLRFDLSSYFAETCTFARTVIDRVQYQILDDLTKSGLGSMYIDRKGVL